MARASSFCYIAQRQPPRTLDRDETISIFMISKAAMQPFFLNFFLLLVLFVHKRRHFMNLQIILVLESFLRDYITLLVAPQLRRMENSPSMSEYNLIKEIYSY